MIVYGLYKSLLLSISVTIWGFTSQTVMNIKAEPYIEVSAFDLEG